MSSKFKTIPLNNNCSDSMDVCSKAACKNVKGTLHGIAKKNKRRWIFKKKEITETDA